MSGCGVFEEAINPQYKWEREERWKKLRRGNCDKAQGSKEKKREKRENEANR